MLEPDRWTRLLLATEVAGRNRFGRLVYAKLALCARSFHGLRALAPSSSMGATRGGAGGHRRLAV